jgi:hypothetical protein
VLFRSVDPEHDGRFIRRCGHLYYRARLAGYKVESGCLLGPACFGGQLPFWMMDILPELHQLKDASFAEIEATSAPVAFTESWNLCVEQLKAKQ